MDGMNFVSDWRARERRLARQTRRREGARALALLLAIALATFAGILGLEACGIAPTVLEAGAVP